jgi:imidazolonepropionase-like amidohydrolase
MMGVIAMIRQTLLDARWYQDAREAYRINPRQRKPEENAALAALEPALRKKAPVWISVEDEHAFLRAARIAREFGLNLRVRGSGYEYRMLDPIKSVGAPVILPVNFPRAEDMKVDTPEDALEVSLEELRHWDAAPENPARLHRAGVTFAFTGYGLKKSSDFHVRIREAIRRGLPHDAALAALTTVPARLLGMDARLGAVEPGKRAFLTVTDGPVFAEKTRIRDVWINGRRHEVNPAPVADPGGNWTVTLSLPGAEPLTVTLDVKGAPGKFRGNLTWNEEKIDLTRVSLDMKRISFLFPGEKLGHEGVWRLSGSVDGAEMGGKGALPDGRGLVWSARLDSSATAPEPAAPVAMDSVALPAPSPAVAFGRSALPTRPKNALVRGATIWTLDSRGKIENADMLITDGKITRIGSNLAAPPDALIIDGKGKHITPGLIDAHSHTAITQGINESSQAVTAEVDIGDIIDSYDIALYRELAGGLTTANVLHGSANPIGGKNQVIKLRWGASPDEMKFEGATPGIKFALGENVKQSNAPTPTSRYPQTRMGVEQIIRDRFRAAQEYERAWKTYEGRKDKRGVIPPRRDLELETLAEILRGERLVHCHSYRQDEILMMIRIADDFGFRIGTFQHVLEGYKVAAEIARHGAGASTFSDWWAFKIEANDAIPHNGALMNRAGVLVTFNSDSDELARRLNTEAAKAVKYGGVDEVEALKFVTLNAARQLRIDNRVGSLEEGKDADFVVWNGHPLSTYTACEQTWIDGRRYFDRNEDTEMRKQVEQERASLIQKILSPEKKEEKKPGPSS